MLNNFFTNTPTVGSQENNPKSFAEECVAQMGNFEERMQIVEQQLSTREHPRYEEVQNGEKPKRKGFKLGKFIKFFSAVIKPILTFLPNLIFAVAGLKKASALARS